MDGLVAVPRPPRRAARLHLCILQAQTGPKPCPALPQRSRQPCVAPPLRDESTRARVVPRARHLTSSRAGRPWPAPTPSPSSSPDAFARQRRDRSSALGDVPLASRRRIRGEEGRRPGQEAGQQAASPRARTYQGRRLTGREMEAKRPSRATRSRAGTPPKKSSTRKPPSTWRTAAATRATAARPARRRAEEGRRPLLRMGARVPSRPLVHGRYCRVVGRSRVDVRGAGVECRVFLYGVGSGIGGAKRLVSVGNQATAWKTGFGPATQATSRVLWLAGAHRRKTRTVSSFQYVCTNSSLARGKTKNSRICFFTGRAAATSENRPWKLGAKRPCAPTRHDGDTWARR